MSNDVTAVVMAAGLGTRMKSATPKHLHPLLGRRLVDWVVEAARDAGVERLVVVTSPDAADKFPGEEIAVQSEPRGTGDAVRSARNALQDVTGDVLVLNGDVPGLSSQTLRDLPETHRGASATSAVLWLDAEDVGGYGRVVSGGDGRLARIVVKKDCAPQELEVGEINSGIYVFRA